jgi:hypothetical protein
VACAFAFDDLSAHLPQSEKRTTKKRSLSAQGRKLAALAARQLNGTLTI